MAAFLAALGKTITGDFATAEGSTNISTSAAITHFTGETRPGSTVAEGQSLPQTSQQVVANIPIPLTVSHGFGTWWGEKEIIVLAASISFVLMCCIAWTIPKGI